jgi:hypothetical protein
MRAAKSAGSKTKASDAKSTVGPLVGEVPASLNAKSSETQKSTDLVASKEARPVAERTRKATDKTAVKPLVGEVAASLSNRSSEEHKSTDPVTPERARSEQATFGFMHVSNSPTSVVDAIYAKGAPKTEATNKEAKNEPEENNNTFEPKTDTDKASRNKCATNTQESSGDTSEPCKGFTDGKTKVKGEKALTDQDAKNIRKNQTL